MTTGFFANWAPVILFKKQSERIKEFEQAQLIAAKQGFTKVRSLSFSMEFTTKNFHFLRIE
jgi:hypothetical protein